MKFDRKQEVIEKKLHGVMSHLFILRNSVTPLESQKNPIYLTVIEVCQWKKPQQEHQEIYRQNYLLSNHEPVKEVKADCVRIPSEVSAELEEEFDGVVDVIDYIESQTSFKFIQKEIIHKEYIGEFIKK